MLKAINIKWDVDMYDIYDRLDDMTAEEAAESLGISKRIYANMTTSERHDLAYETFYGYDNLVAEFMDLPTEVEIPEDLAKKYEENEDGYAEDISDWLSDEYEFCNKGFNLVDTEKELELE